MHNTAATALWGCAKPTKIFLARPILRSQKDFKVTAKFNFMSSSTAGWWSCLSYSDATSSTLSFIQIKGFNITELESVLYFPHSPNFRGLILQVAGIPGPTWTAAGLPDALQLSYTPLSKATPQLCPLITLWKRNRGRLKRPWKIKATKIWETPLLWWKPPFPQFVSLDKSASPDGVK